MAFVKLDCGILNSTLWIDADARTIFITALLMAEPHEVVEPRQQIQVRTFDYAEFIVPPGWYGFVPAAGIGIIHRAGLDKESGMAALERLGNPENDSRTPAHEGRRLVRVDGGYIVLNFDKYRQKDHTAKDRQARYRAAKRNGVTVSCHGVETATVTQAEAEAEAEAENQPFVRFWKAYPKKIGKGAAEKAWKKIPTESLEAILKAIENQRQGDQWRKEGGQFIPYPATWLNQKRWLDVMQVEEAPRVLRGAEPVVPKYAETNGKSF